MTAGRHCPRSHWAGVGSTSTTAHSFDPLGIIVSISHPIVEDNWCGCRYVHDDYPVLRGPLVLAVDGRHQHYIYWLPEPKSCRVIVQWRLLLSEDVGWDVLWHLYIKGFLDVLRRKND